MNKHTRVYFSVALIVSALVLMPLVAVAQVSEFERLVQTAAQLYLNRKYDEALASANKAAAMNPKDFRPHGIAGLVMRAQNNNSKAFELFEITIQLKPPPEQLRNYYLLKADVAIKLDKLAEAIESSKKAIELDPNFPAAYATLAEALNQDGKRNSEALAAYRTAIKLDPQNTLLMSSLESLLIEMKDEKLAEQTYRELMAADPKHMAGRFRLGPLLVKQGRLTEARELWEARTADDDNVQPSFIQVLTRAENLKRATEQLAQKPNDPEALNQMGLAVMDGDSWVIDYRQDRAIVYFRKALALQPQYVEAPTKA
jgi:tetratricopeptide (TPR) repeat protein